MKDKSVQDNALYRQLSSDEKSTLVKNCNKAQNWDSVWVSNNFDPNFVCDCHFWGEIKIGATKDSLLERFDFSAPIGLYNSTFIDCTIGDFVSISNLHYCANYTIGNNVIIHNVGELISSDSATFGNGVLKNGEKTSIDLVNEIGGRAIIPFDGIICTDAFLWAKYRENKELLRRLEQITVSTCSANESGAFIGNDSVLRNIKSICGCKIGENTLVYCSEIILNTTIHSDSIEHTYIGAGVQLRNAIIGFGNNIDSGTQLNTVVTGCNVSISQSARIMHSFIGDNSAIACCEIAHSLLAPSHAQHHNNSFLIATSIGGQCNIAAGATIGSNHNSRVNDGEIWASRGFWPGLCTSLKHNSKFASYTMIAKGSYPSELNISFPFSLVVNDIAKNSLLLFPAYWFYCNMYALMRSRLKYSKRDKRVHKNQVIEHDPLAPDTIEEIFKAVNLLETLAGENWFRQNSEKIPSEDECQNKGKMLFEHNGCIPDELVSLARFEKGNRPVIIRNAFRARKAYLDIIRWYAAKIILSTDIKSLNLSVSQREKNWINCGGQIWAQKDFADLINKIQNDSSISTWNDIHNIYYNYESTYKEQKLTHAISCLATLDGIKPQEFNLTALKTSLGKVIAICKRISEITFESREKDYTGAFRTLIYDTENELKAVLGDIREDSVIRDIELESQEMIEKINAIIG